MSKKHLIVFGTRPEYLKIKSLITLFEEKSIPFTLLQVLQHENLHIEESQKSYYAQVSLHSDPSISRLTQLASEISKHVEPFILQATTLFIQGDTATAFFTALSAFHHKVPIYHIEAGLRTYDLKNPFPEEAYRSMISRIASYHLCPDEAAHYNLKSEQITAPISIVGNTILDVVKQYNFPCSIGNQVIVTVHRRENWDKLLSILQGILHLATTYPEKEFVWILHPNPSLQKQCFDFMNTQTSLSNFRFLQPQDHKTLCKMICDCYCAITDSGGIQEEASFLGKTCFVMRETTERSSIPEPYILLTPTVDWLAKYFKETKISLLDPCHVYGDGTTAQQILNVMKKNNHV